MASAGLQALRRRLRRVSGEQLEALLLNPDVPAIAQDEIQREARRRTAPTTTSTAGAWEVVSRSPPGTPPGLDRDELRPVAVPRIRHPLARLRAMEASTGHPPTTALRPPRLGAPQPPMQRAHHITVASSGLTLDVAAAQRLLQALAMLTARG